MDDPFKVDARVRKIIDGLPRAVFLADSRNVVLAWNPGAETVFGHSCSYAVGRCLTELLGTASGGNPLEGALALARSGSIWAGEVEATGSDGLIRLEAQVAPWTADDGTIVGVLVAAADVTRLSAVEKRSADLAEHLRLALSAGDLGTWRWDRRTGRAELDETLARLFGRELGEIESTYDGWLSLIHPDDAAGTAEAVDKAVAERSSYEVEHRVVWPDGTVRWILGRGTVTLDDVGEVTGTIGCASDITDRKLAELYRDARIREAEAAARRERLTRERLEFLTSLNDAAMSTTDHLEFMRLVTARAVPRLGDWCTIHFIGEPGSEPIIELAHSDPVKVAWLVEVQARYPFDPDAPSGVAAVIRTGLPEVVRVDAAMIDQVLLESPYAGDDDLRQILDLLDLTSVVTVPLVTRRGVVGAMQFVSAESGRVYDDDDLTLAMAAAGRVGAALDNLWLSEQYRAVAHLLQQELLPADVPTVDGVGIAVRYWAAGVVNEAGGDFYDVFPSGSDRWSVVIGDVCGTGPQAAAITSRARHTVRAAAMHGHDHIEVIEWVNDAIRSSRRRRFCTLLYATLDRQPDGTWLYTSVAGGHPRPILVRASGEIGLIGAHGTLVGVLPRLELTVTPVVLGPGDTVVMYTDGLTDVRPPHGLTEEEMRDVVAEAVKTSSSAESAADQLRAHAAELLPLELRSDDMALVVLRVDSDT